MDKKIIRKKDKNLHWTVKLKRQITNIAKHIIPRLLTNN